jgi:inositol oxygenase
VEYALKMKERYLKFNARQMSLREALDFVSSTPADVDSHDISLRTLCFRTAEYFRKSGHPDWMQLVALVYGLASVVKRDDNQSCAPYDWTICSRSRVLGCPIPNHVAFGAFQALNPDNNNKKYSSSASGMYQRNCGLDHVLLTWTGPEYMYHMLRHNRVDFPGEALKIQRLASLSDWHTTTSLDRAYTEICTDEDYEVRSLVADFDYTLQAARTECLLQAELTVDECNLLWMSYYADLASKYRIAEPLEW